MLPLTCSAVGYSILKRQIPRSETPEYLLAASVVNAQVLIGVGIAMSGGPHSPAIPILLLPIVLDRARRSVGVRR